ncbi:MAG: pilus (MSHA type) biogenesis protein MshL [Rhodocyclaceae bacterium]
MTLRIIGNALAALFLTACASPTIREPSGAHLRASSASPTADRIPSLVQQSSLPPRPKSNRKTETYSVVVKDIKVHDLLFALARDARLNVDIHSGISGNVTLNAIEQTLPQLLNRIARQTDMRFELDGPNLAVMPDTPFLRNYAIDYVNMSRETNGTVAVTTQIASAGSNGSNSSPGGSLGANNSLTRIDNRSKNHFWDTLVQNIKDILRETDKILPDGSSETAIEQASVQNTTGTGAASGASSASVGKARSGQNITSLAGSPNAAALHNTGTTVVRHTTFREAASVIAHPESGVLIIRATSRQHEKLQEFLDKVMSSARRQVLIEATIAEVHLNSNYQQGIDWQVAPFGAAGFTLLQKAVGTVAAPTASLLQLGYTNAQGNMSATVRLLESFGNVKVLSSPKISVLNNQTAVLKVVDNNVYFTIKADTTQNQTTTVTTFTTTVNQVPVGFVMNVTPQISDNDNVLLNIRPSISRIIGTATDPNPTLAAAGVTSTIPIIRSREIESVLRVENGNIAVMGGLMEDTLDNTDHAVPGISGIPVLGQLFTQHNDAVRKTELVIFLRPLVIREASIEGDYSAFRDALPGKRFFTDHPDPQRQRDESGKESGSGAMR